MEYDATPFEMDARRAQDILQYHFTDIDRLIEALQAPGSGLTNIHGRPLTDGNKRLAILGDTVIKTVALGQWYDTEDDRARANGIVARVRARGFLENCARMIGLDRCVTKNAAQRDDPASPLLLTSTVTAIVAAVWLDSGRSVDATLQVMKTLGMV